jgi:Tfp pilus assembly protein PilX
MKLRITHRIPPASRGAARPAYQGFALVITLSLMILLVVVAVGLLSLSTISLRSASSQKAMAAARANARMAMILAIGEIQRQAGPDQSITFTSGILTDEGADEPANPDWTGAMNVRDYDRRSNSKQTSITWLVSGEDPDPTAPLEKSTEWNKGTALLLGTYRKSGESTDLELLAPVVNMTVGSDKNRIAWWVDDQATKARVDIEKPPANTSASITEKDGRSQSPVKPLLSVAGQEWKDFTRNSTIDSSSLLSVSTSALAAESEDIPEIYFTDVTTGGHGLPTNVVEGGYKADLSLIFDRSQRTKKFAETYFGVKAPTRSGFNGVGIDKFPTDINPAVVNDPKKFHLSSTLSDDGSVSVGPNWGILWNYATLWQNVSAEQIPLIGTYPSVWSDLRRRDWLPYTNQNSGTYQNDLQHTNSPVAPVISTLQMGFRLKSQLVKAANPAANQPALYKAQVEIKPLMGIWNPYNVTISATPYRFDWALYPFFRLNYSRSDGQDSRLTRLWLRREWAAGSGDMPTDDNETGGRYFSMETPAVDIRPGETRLFSVTRQIDLKSQGTQRLEAAWSEKGAFVVDLTYKKTNANGDIEYATREIPAGHECWFGDIIMQDTLATTGSGVDNFNTEFPGFDFERNSSSWFTLKAGDNVLFRTTDLWNGDPKATVMVPEPVVSGWNGGASNNTTKVKHRIEDIAGENYVPHIATWSFFNRTTTQLQDGASNQRLRGWFDSNPRTLVSMPLWDGSMVRNRRLEGWNFTSNLIGGWHDPAPKGVVGDGNNSYPNRGLIGEGGRAEPEPQISDVKRYSGFNGSSNTTSGQANVIVFDVPRSPLISIGQFQHAQLSRYNFDPGFVVGNSLANPRIPLNSIAAGNFVGKAGLTIADISYEANERLWDAFFFSTLGNDYLRKTGNSLDKNFKLADLVSGAQPLTNPRMRFAPLPGDESIDKIIQDSATADRAPEAIAARMLVKGAFNVNSTSKTAWKAFLSSMANSELPVVTQPSSSAGWNKISWENPDGIRFNRFGRPMCKSPYENGASGAGPEFWLGWRSLSEPELDELATEIVKEVKERGPFRSMAEFVNRNPYSAKTVHQLKGGLQAALDRTVNMGLPSDVGGTATKPNGSQFSAAVTGENEAAGNAAYLTQGDVLQSLAPLMQVRADYFRIRTCGEALDSSGKVIARAWCEAYVQRTPEYVDPEDPAHFKYGELASDSNKRFGRRFEIVSFRWLNQSEI